MASSESNAQKIEKIKSLMETDTLTTRPSDPITPRPPGPPTVQPDPSQAPLIEPSPLEKLPDELIILVLAYELRVHRITPRLCHSFGSNSTIRRLSLVSQRIRHIAREAYYRINVVKSMHFGSVKYLLGEERLNFHFQLPSETARPWIRHLEMELKITDRDIDGRQIQLTSQMAGGLGVLLRPKHRQSARTAWQADLKKLNSLTIILLGSDSDVRDLCNILSTESEDMAIELRPMSFELRMQHGMEAYDGDIAAISDAFKSMMDIPQSV